MKKFELGPKYAKRLDEADELSKFRQRFYIPKNTIYLDGNSLGLMSKDSEKTIKRIIGEWKNLGVKG